MQARWAAIIGEPHRLTAYILPDLVRATSARRPLVRLLGHTWSEAILAAGSYPPRIAGVYRTGGGPHFGSGLTIDTAAELHENKA